MFATIPYIDPTGTKVSRGFLVFVGLIMANQPTPPNVLPPEIRV